MYSYIYIYIFVYTYFTKSEICIHVANPSGFIWRGISLAKGLISCNCHVSGNQWKSNVIDRFVFWVRVPKMYFPQRAGQRASKNGFGVWGEQKGLYSFFKSFMFHCHVWCEGCRFLFYTAPLHDSFCFLLQYSLIQ